MSFIIGIDPGAAGAVAIMESGTGKLVQVFDMPSVEILAGGKSKKRVAPYLLAEELRLYNVLGTRAVVEHVAAMPGQGVTSMFAFGHAFGLALGVLAGMGISVELVTPFKWKKDLKVNAGKDGSRLMAMTLWPDQAGEFKRVRDDGRAEASLIAHWARVTS
jgi:crossover junction endodeoxyribonuclease RuvC